MQREDYYAEPVEPACGVGELVEKEGRNAASHVEDEPLWGEVLKDMAEAPGLAGAGRVKGGFVAFGAFEVLHVGSIGASDGSCYRECSCRDQSGPNVSIAFDALFSKWCNLCALLEVNSVWRCLISSLAV